MRSSVQLLTPVWTPMPAAAATRSPARPALVVRSDGDPLDAERQVLELAARVGAASRIAVIGPAGPVHEALRAFAASAAGERAGGSSVSIEVEPTDAAALAMADDLAQDPAYSGALRISQGQRWRRTWVELPAPARAPIPSRAALVTGGLGGLGRLVAAHLARGGTQVTLVGRSALSDAARAWLEGIPGASYAVADVCTPEGAALAVREAGPELDLVIHAAGVKVDGPLERARTQDLQAALSVKLRGTWNLWRATQRRPVRVALFGSLAGVNGNPGQAAYAAGNAWMQGFAATMGEGRVQSLAWTYWEEGGMTLPEAGRAAMTRAGLRGLSSAEGLAALEDAMAMDQAELSVVARLPEAPVRADAAALEPLLIAALDGVLKLGGRPVDPEAELSDYGLDSIGLTQLAAAIVERLPQVSVGASAFVEHSTIRALARHLASATPQASAPAPGLTPPPRPAPSPAPAPVVDPRPAPVTPAVTLGAALRGWLDELPPPPRPAPSPAAPTAPPAGSIPIAIIGYAARLPGPGSLAALHAALCGGERFIRRAPADRWDWREWEGDPEEGDNRTDCHLGGFLSEIGRFDAEHFHISPREAALMDPQHRLLLTLSWEALERAGYDPRSLKGEAVATLIGAGRNEYGALLAASHAIEAHSNTGNTPALLSNRLSWTYGWTGLSHTLDAGCAGSMVAVAEAVAALRRGDAVMALAGGVSLIGAPHGMVSNRRMGLLTASGRVRSYDAEADGHVFGEGAGLVLLKPLARALADGDTIHGVIRGVSVTHSGRTPTLTTPSASAQAAAIRGALDDAGLDAEALSAILGQGTATAASDAAELGAYRAALAPRSRPAPLCSLDSALGHLESASGVAALLVGLEVLRTGVLPPVAGFGRLNAQAAEHAPLPVVISAAETRLEAGLGPSRVGVHNFGYGGVNTHLVLEEPPPRRDAHPSAGPALLLLSAPRPAQLDAMATALGQALAATPGLELRDVAFTLRAGRRAFKHRLALVVHSLDEAAARLAGHSAERPAGELGQVELPTGAVAAGDLDALARAFCRGDALPAPERGRRVPLPTLPLSEAASGAGLHWAAAPPAGPGAPRWDGAAWSMDRRWSAADPLLDQHRVQGAPTLPAACALAALHALIGASGRALAVDEAVWAAPLRAPEGGRVAARLSLRGGDAQAEAELRGADGLLHFHATLGAAVPRAAATAWPKELSDPSARRVSGEALRVAMASAGLALGPALSAVEEVVVQGEWAFGRLRAPAGAAGLDLETALVDGAFQVASVLLSTPSLPVSARALWREAELSGATQVRAARLADAGRLRRVTLELADDEGRVLMTLGQLGLLSVEAAAQGAPDAAPTSSRSAPGSPPLTRPPPPRPPALEAEVRALIAGVLRADPSSIHPERPLARYGLDSILAVEAARALSERFGRLSATSLFEHESTAALARYISELAPSALPEVAPPPTAARSRAAPRPDPEAVAIIGMAGRYPSAPDLDALWELMAADRSAITAPPTDRWDPDELERIDPGGRTRYGGFLDGVELFDHALFDIPKATAATMDPQVRLALEVAWQTLCAAGYPPERLAEAQGDAGVGVFVASMAAPYPAVAEEPEAAAWLGHVTGWPLANRVSHALDLRGPSVAVDAACAGGLAAVHLAAESVRRGEASMALAAGVSLILHPSKLASLGQSGLGGVGEESMSLRGGEGYLPAEGCGAVLLRPLSDALAAGDRVLGVLRASGMGHNGRSAGMHTPSAGAQARLIRAVRAQAGDAGARVSAVECGATGARLGDAVEIAALKRAYGDLPAGSVAFSTVKANLGHAEGASGLAQLHRALLQLGHRQLLPTRGADRLDPDLGWEGSALAPVRALRPWGEDGATRVIAVNCTGAGGANAHLVLESAALEEARPAPPSQPRLFVLSGRTEAALAEAAARLARALRRARPRLDDLSYTLLIAAPRHAHRLAALASDGDALATALEAWIAAPEDPHPGIHVGRAGPGLADALSGALGEAVAAALPSAADPRAATLWVSGVELPWARLTPPGARLLQAPPYVFERARCWLHDGPLLCRPTRTAARPAPDAAPPPRPPVTPPAPSPSRAALEEALVALVGPAAILDGARPLRQVGLDSLLSLQLANRVERATGLRIEASALQDQPSLDSLEAHLRDRLASAAPAAARPPPPPPTAPAPPPAARPPPLPQAPPGPLPLSVNQRWHWTLHRLLPEQPGLLTIPVALRLVGALQVDRLHAALQAVVARHPALRRGFLEGEEGPSQHDHARAELPLRRVVLRGMTDDASQAAARAALEADQAPFLLKAPPLLRATLIQLGESEHLLGLTAHHLALDLWSMGLLIRELAERYTASIEARPPRLTPIEGGLDELLAWEARTWTQETVEARAAALLDGLPKILEPLELGAQGPTETRAAALRRALPRAALGPRVANGERTAFEQLFAALVLRLAAQTEATDLLIGVPVLGREFPAAEGALGFYADVATVHVRVDLAHSRARVAAAAIASLRAALAQRLPFPDALRALRSRQVDPSRPPVSVCVTYSARAEAPRMAGLEVRMADSGRAHLVFDLFLTVIEGEGELELVLEYEPDRVGHEGAARLLEDVERVLGATEQQPDRPAGALLPELGLARRPRVRVAGTFSLDGLDEAMRLWAAPLQLDFRVELAGYQQAIQELLMPNSGLARLAGGLGALLVRMWDGRADPTRFVAELGDAVEGALPRLESPLLLVRCPDPPTAEPAFKRSADSAWRALRARLGERVGWLEPEAVFSDLNAAALHDPVADREAHLPYSIDGVLALGAALVRRLAGQALPPYKVLAVDCDNTLWVGVVGEQGPTGVVVDAPRARLQRLLIAAVEAGALIVLLSKNEEVDVAEALAQHPDLLLRRDHVTRIAASWRPKSQVLREVLADLNLGLGDVLFLDDNPMEIAEMEAALPQVSAVRVPVEPDALASLLDRLWPLDPRVGTAADHERTAMYRVVADRAALQRAHSSYREFLDALELEVEVAPVTPADLPRVSQLTLRTTQFNASNRRRSEADLRAWLQEPDRVGRVVRARDRFGDYGLVGVLLAEARGGALHVDTLLMSCRVLGRGVEHRTLIEAGRLACALGLTQVSLRCTPTARNQPMRDFLEEVLGEHGRDEAGARRYVADSALVAKLSATPPEAAPPPVEETPLATGGAGRAAVLRSILALSTPEALRAALARRRPRAQGARPDGSPPQSESERLLAELWREVLGAAPSREDDFFALGGDSLAATRLLSRVAARWGEVGLTLDAVFAAPTLAAMAAHLDTASLAHAADFATMDEEALDQAFAALSAGRVPQVTYEL